MGAMKRGAPCAAGLTCAALTVLVAACGGGEPPDKSAARTLPTERLQSTAVASPDADAFFDWAEQRYPDLFPRGMTTQKLDHDGIRYTLRHYPTTGNHLGLVHGGTVYGLGSFTQGTITSFGLFEPYLCQFAPSTCAPRTANTVSVVVDAGYRQCEPDSGTSLLDMRRRLVDAGIPVVASNCGAGRFGVPAACGFTDGRYWIFDIDASNTGKARELGLKLPDEDRPAEAVPARCAF